MTSLAVRLMEIDDTQLEEFIEVWVERRSQQYDRIERTGAANDKGRDVVNDRGIGTPYFHVKGPPLLGGEGHAGQRPIRRSWSGLHSLIGRG